MARKSLKDFTSADFICAAVLATTAALLYASFRSKFYVFEGLARAMPIELGHFSNLFNGNYLIYGFIGNCFHVLLRSLGFSVLSVVSLQIMDALIGGAGLFLFFYILRKLEADRGVALIWTAVLGLSLGYWSWSSDAQNYIFSTFLLIINMGIFVLYASGRRISPILLGALHALAVMGHIINGIFAVVGIFFVASREGRYWRKPLMQYVLTSGLCIVAAYCLTLIFIVRPADLEQALNWFGGSLMVGENGAPHWHGGFSLSSLLGWLKMSLHIFSSFSPEFSDPHPWRYSWAPLLMAKALLGIFVVLFLTSYSGIKGLKRTVAFGCLVWLGAYALVFTSWEPDTMVYRVSDLIPMTILLFLAADSAAKPGRWHWAGLALAFFLGTGNFTAELYPRSFESNSPQLARMAFLKAQTPEGAWIIGEGQDELYIPFFAERKPIVIGRYGQRLDDLRRMLRSLLEAKQAVYVTSRIISAPHWARFFSPCIELQARHKNGFELYRLIRVR